MRSTYSLLPAALLGAVAVATPLGASAQTADLLDVRCVLTMAAAASNPDVQSLALNGVYFFAARVLSQEPDFDFSRRLRVEADRMSLTDFRAETTRCVNVLQGVARNLTRAQSSLRGFQPKP
jgi:hypothetical protein